MIEDSHEEPIARVFCECYVCDKDICEGEDYYEIGGMDICEDCICEFKHTAELEEN